MNESDLAAAHYHMLTQCHERIEFDYLSNILKGVAAPVVLLLDLRAPLAQAMCREVRTESTCTRRNDAVSNLLSAGAYRRPPPRGCCLENVQILPTN